MLARLSKVDAEIVAMAFTNSQGSSVNRTVLSDLLWEATNLTFSISTQLCVTGRVWADLDMFFYLWRRLPELVQMCRRAGIIEIGIADIAGAASVDSHALYEASEHVDECQLDLVSRPDHEPTRLALIHAVEQLAIAGDQWFMHAFSSRSEAYCDAGYALLVATEHRCIKERNALIAQ